MSRTEPLRTSANPPGTAEQQQPKPLTVQERREALIAPLTSRLQALWSKKTPALTSDEIHLLRLMSTLVRLSDLDTLLTLPTANMAMLVATLSGIGQTTAMMLGNNTSTALSGQDMMRSQLSQNMGNTADTQIAKMISNERIVVTLAAGTELYMVFTKASHPQNSPQQSPSATSSSHIQPISESLTGR